MYQVIIFVLILVLSSCDRPVDAQTTHKIYEIAARDDGTNNRRPVIYRVKVPSEWVYQNSDNPLMDTTKPLCEFFITSQKEPGQKIRLTIHNFPSASPNDRIPPAAQIARWKKQFTKLDPASISMTSQSFAGFYGQLLEAHGFLNDKETAIMAWSMQLAQEHYSTLALQLQLTQSPTEKQNIIQMKSDFTIKATGPKRLMKKHRREIIAFARSFEFIEEIPSTS